MPLYQFAATLSVMLSHMAFGELSTADKVRNIIVLAAVPDLELHDKLRAKVIHDHIGAQFVPRLRFDVFSINFSSFSLQIS